MPTMADLVSRLTKLLNQQLEDHPDAPVGVHFDAHDDLIDDDGGYGDPMRDERPDFVKRDERGWQKIASLRR